MASQATILPHSNECGFQSSCWYEFGYEGIVAIWIWAFLMPYKWKSEISLK